MQRQPTKSVRQARIRAKIYGTAQRPRLSVFRSLTHIYVQLIDDVTGRTLVAASDREPIKAAGDNSSKNIQRAMAVGLAIAAKAKAAGITTVVFDRSGYKYHGRVKAVAEGARTGGLIF